MSGSELAAPGRAAAEVALAPQLSAIDAIGMSLVGHHQDHCCADAYEWLRALLDGERDLGAALAAVPAVIAWGPTRWPTYWCALPRPGGDRPLAGDCGVHAHIASLLLQSRGVAHRRGRAAIAVEGQLSRHWSATWSGSDASRAWLGDGLVHHEVLRVGESWWDPSEACWFDGPGARLNCGWVVAVRDDDGEWTTRDPP